MKPYPELLSCQLCMYACKSAQRQPLFAHAVALVEHLFLNCVDGASISVSCFPSLVLVGFCVDMYHVSLFVCLSLFFCVMRVRRSCGSCFPCCCPCYWHPCFLRRPPIWRSCPCPWLHPRVHPRICATHVWSASTSAVCGVHVPTSVVLRGSWLSAVLELCARMHILFLKLCL